jgi:hypothetical protein
MATSPHYNRSEILSFYELTAEQQEDILCSQEPEQAEQDRYVIFKGESKSSAALPLSMFMRTDRSKIWDGIYGTSYFSAYFIKINRSGDGALIAEKFC